ncbi:MAG: hypothetical protein ACP5QI_08800 [Candidatus Bathyarchaeia archaeon]
MNGIAARKIVDAVEEPVLSIRNPAITGKMKVPRFPMEEMIPMELPHSLLSSDAQPELSGLGLRSP